jgi:hypothetical protein
MCALQLTSIMCSCLIGAVPLASTVLAMCTPPIAVCQAGDQVEPHSPYVHIRSTSDKPPGHLDATHPDPQACSAATRASQVRPLPTISHCCMRMYNMGHAAMCSGGAGAADGLCGARCRWEQRAAATALGTVVLCRSDAEYLRGHLLPPSKPALAPQVRARSPEGHGAISPPPVLASTGPSP